MKKILGLDLGTNSIGWALVEIDHKKGIVKIIGLGSRILPMDAGEVKKFKEGGKIDSTAAQRTEKRGPRRLNERFLLRRDRLHLVLNLLDTLPVHYKLEIDFKNKKGEKCGQFKKNMEPKLAYNPKGEKSKASFLFMDSYEEMIKDIDCSSVKNEKRSRIPYDWTLYYLRQKALSEKISLEELAWVLLSYNQKRGYEKIEAEDKSAKEGEIVEEFDLRVKEVVPKKDNNGRNYFEIHLEGNDLFVYKEFSEEQMTFVDDLKEIVKTSKVDEKGTVDVKKTIFRVIDIYSLEIKNLKYEREDGKHSYTLTYQNGWSEVKQPKSYTFKYKNALQKPFDYIVETIYDYTGNVKKQQGKERKFREPDLSDNSSDWTLLKKKTEKEALSFNISKGFKNEQGSARNYISPKIYDVLKNDAKSGKRTKIIGGMFQVVDRDFYREELNQIITTQREFHKTLNDEEVFEKCVKTLYPNNANHSKALLENKNAIQHLLVEDILLYQRPLKSKKSEIGDCKYEVRYTKSVLDKKGKPVDEIDFATGEIKPKIERIYNKAVSTSHPIFQEFRIWDKLHNLKLIQLEKEVDGKPLTNQDITKEIFKTEKEYQALFEELNNRKSLNQKQFIKFCKDRYDVIKKVKTENLVWNFPEDDELKGNETRVNFSTRFKRCGFSDEQFLVFMTQEKELDLWHYLYSVSYLERTADNNKSLTSFFNRFLKDIAVSDTVKNKLINDFENFPKFASKYAAYSEKALKKLVPLIQKGKENKVYFWETEKWYLNWEASLDKRKEDIVEKLAKLDFTIETINWQEVVDNTAPIPFPKGLFRAFKEVTEFETLNLTQASYLVYGRHSELAEAKYWKSPKQIREELHKELKQHSLNNPVAEKVLLEMMQVVADIWEHFGEQKTDYEYEKGDGYEVLFDRIHLEVGRELKKSVKEKNAETSRMSSNRKQNKRIRQILEEYLSESNYNANPRNSDHFERLKIVEEGAEHTKNTDKYFFTGKSYNKKDIEDILKKPKISKTDFEKYKLWIEQGYKSPYSGQIIKLTDLFDGTKYNIDHVFPQAAVTNNSLSNKVVVEVSLNKLKRDRTARQFIQDQKGLSHFGVPVCSEEDYIAIVRTQFSGLKRSILLSKEIPKGFTNSQMNNARYISRKAMELLSHVVRGQGEVEFRSKNVLPVTGRITSELKQAWRLNEVWTELVSPRFIRMNELTHSNLFGSWQTSKSGHQYFDCHLDDSIREKDDSYDIKRIDHRHHALDALIVALCTEDHVNYINNINADTKSDNYGKQKQIEKYRQTLKRKIKFNRKDDETDEKNWFYMLPGEKRQGNEKNSRRDSVIEMVYQYKSVEYGQDWKQMAIEALQDTVTSFKQNLRVINSSVNYYRNTPDKKKLVRQKLGEEKGNKKNWSIRRSLGKSSFYGKKIIAGEDKIVIRKDLDFTFDSKKIKTITDTGTQKILLNHLKQFDTVKLPFDEAIPYFDFLLEKDELIAIVENTENDFYSIDDFVIYLKANRMKYDKVDYSMLNVLLDKVERDFRNEVRFKGSIEEHPEIAFTPEEIEEMNKPEFLFKLNEGKNHAPIYKVRVSRGFGNQRALNGDDLQSVKSKQFVVNDAGSNLYLGVYERIHIDESGKEVRERKYKNIGLTDLIENLKQDIDSRLHPLPIRMYDDNQNEYNRVFTLSPLDLVYVPTEEEMQSPSLVDFENLTEEQVRRVYKYVDGNAQIANFILNSVSKPLWRFHGKKNKEIYKDLSEMGKIMIKEKELIQNEFGLGSQQNKNQNSICGKQVKSVCWKLKVDRLGNISKI